MSRSRHRYGIGHRRLGRGKRYYRYKVSRGGVRL